MNIITQPVVYLIGKQELLAHEVEAFLIDQATEWKQEEKELVAASEKITEFGGRLCYMSFPTPRPGGIKAYIDHIKEVGHGSVLEHAVWTIAITHVSRTLTHELVRHRAGMAYSQLSQRYVEESVAEFVEPDIIASDPEMHSEWVIAVSSAHDAYISLVDKIKQRLETDATFRDKWNVTGDKTGLKKLARQAARSVLPNATETKILVTANARAWRHFLEQRGSRFAEPEIRKLADSILTILYEQSPNIFGDYQRVWLADGTNELTTAFRKV